MTGQRPHRQDDDLSSFRVDGTRSGTHSLAGSLRQGGGYLEVPTVPPIPEDDVLPPASAASGIAAADETGRPEAEGTGAAAAFGTAAGGASMGGTVPGSVKTEGESYRGRMDNLVDDIELGKAHYIWSASRAEDDDVLGRAKPIYALPNGEDDSVMGAVWYGEPFDGSQAPSSYTLTPHTNRFSSSLHTPVMSHGYAASTPSAHTAYDPGTNAPNTMGGTSDGFFSNGPSPGATSAPFTSVPTPSMRTAYDPGTDALSSDEATPREPEKTAAATQPSFSPSPSPSPQESKGEDDGD